MTANPNPDFDEEKWVLHIRNSLKDDQLEIEIYETPVCIFNVPKILLSTNPDCYTPQEVAIGPYHYRRRETYEMERYKLAAAKRNQKKLSRQGFTLHDVVDQLKEMDIRTRACYHKFIYFSDTTLAWMMAIDASFLLEFLLVYAVKEGKVTRDSSIDLMSYLVDYGGTKSAHKAILRDMVMLENQIPLIVLRKILEFHYSSMGLADDMLQTMLIGFCEELSPFTITKNAAKACVSESYHLLDYLYDVVVPEHKHSKSPQASDEEDELSQPATTTIGAKKGFNPGYLKFLTSEMWKRISKSKIFTSKPLKLLLKLPLKIFSKIPGLSVMAKPVQYLFFPKGTNKKDESSSSLQLNDGNKAPLVEEIEIPSVRELIKSRVRFTPTKSGNISRIRFDTKTATFHLPSISVDINSEVVMRNLVAYEASNASGPLIFTRYTALMDGITDTEEDVKLLRERGIILNRLKSDGEVAILWNGMSKSIRLTKVPSIDKVIEDVNKYYNSRWRVKMSICMRRYVFESWKILTLLATFSLLLLMMLQGFCSVYDCTRLFHINIPIPSM